MYDLESWCYLIASHQMQNNAGIGEINEPKGLVEPEARQEISWCFVPESRVSKASTAEIEKGCH